MSSGARLRPGDRVLFCEVAGEAVLLDEERGLYFGLNEVGARVWALLLQHGTVEAVVTALAGEYEVSSEKLRADVLDLVGKLAQKGLVRCDEA